MFSLGFFPRIKPVFFIVLLLLSIWNTSKAQENLVPNGSFEEYNWCPNWSGFYIDACKFWTSPTLGTPDYFNRCSVEYDLTLESYMFSVPQNYYGTMDAIEGNAYGGFVFGQNEVGSQTYSEYLQIKLKEPLIDGGLYELKFFLHNPKTNYCINSVGALFTSNELNLNTEEVIPSIPQIQSNPNVYFCDTTKWYEVKETFIANGGERFLTLGVFKKLPELKVIDYQGNEILEFPSAYFFIDDISLKKVEINLGNVFTPNGDGINDTYYINLENIGAQNAKILNRWGEIVYSSDTILDWDGTSNNKLCKEGVYFIKIQFKKNILNGFIHLIR